ncbi:hypothetical protein [Nocardioides sp.]|uniref:hypothetical protein n=1 Tax=Nocardioides sp. TaxID=35761 RepID=UPI0026181685|nr:hypothetical protein [Nocardioides sp.]
MSRNVAAQWPELFVGLTPGQRRTVVRNLARAYPAGAPPTRVEVDDMVQYVVGEITPTEYQRRCSRARSAPVAAGRA